MTTTPHKWPLVRLMVERDTPLPRLLPTRGRPQHFHFECETLCHYAVFSQLQIYIIINADFFCAFRADGITVGKARP
jgi:hypothetical protein